MNIYFNPVKIIYTNNWYSELVRYLNILKLDNPIIIKIEELSALLIVGAKIFLNSVNSYKIFLDELFLIASK